MKDRYTTRARLFSRKIWTGSQLRRAARSAVCEPLETRWLYNALVPSQVKHAYGIDQVMYGTTVGDGSGQTIAIIDPGDDQALVNSTSSNFASSDLYTFDHAGGVNLPDPPNFSVVGENGGSRPSYVGIATITESGTTLTVTTTSADGLSTGSSVTIVEAGVPAYDNGYTVTSTPNSTTFTCANTASPPPTGLPTSTGGTIQNPVDTGESTLDVEWAHAIAPGANIILIEMTGFGGTDVTNAVNTAVSKGASVASMSFGFGEFSSETASGLTSFDDGIFARSGVTFIASTGDNGAPAAFPSYTAPIDPLLGALANTGGTTQTEAPQAGSPALGAGIGLSTINTDQRGVARATSGAVDIGSVQNNSSPATITGTAVYLRLATDGQTLDVYLNNTGTGTPAQTYVLANLSSLTVNGTSGNDQLTVDYSNGLPIPGTFSYNGSGGYNTYETIGTAGNDFISFSPTTVVFGSTATFTNVQNLLVDPKGGTDVLLLAANVTVAIVAQAPGAGVLVRTFSAISLGTGARLVAASPASHSDRTLMVVQSVSFGNNAVLDLGSNDADFPAVSGLTLSNFNGLVSSGYNYKLGANWSGSGITSSAAAGDTSHLTALGVVQNNQSGTPLFSSTKLFDGIVPGASDVLVKYTYVGDANLDGAVNGSDYSKIDAGYASRGASTGWANGDFNYDGVVDGSNYTMIDNAFNKQQAALPSAVVASETAGVKHASQVRPGAVDPVDEKTIHSTAGRFVATVQPTGSAAVNISPASVHHQMPDPGLIPIGRAVFSQVPLRAGLPGSDFEMLTETSKDISADHGLTGGLKPDDGFGLIREWERGLDSVVSQAQFVA